MKRLLRLGSALLVCAATGALAASAPVAIEREPIDVRLAQARTEARAATAEQKRLEEAASKARDDVSRLHAQQLAAAQAITAAEAQISAADAQEQLTHALLAAQRKRLVAEQRPVSALLGALVLTSRRPPLLVVADSRSADELVKLRVLVSATSPYIRSKTAALTRELQRDAELETAALAARRQLRRSREELSRRRTRFAQLEQRAFEVAKHKGNRALGAGDVALALQDRLSAAEEEARSERGSAQLARELAREGPAPLPPAPPARSSPLEYRLPANAAVIDGLGSVSANGVRSRGVTLATRRGTPLFAPASGTILFTGPFGDYDGIVIIDHGHGWKSVLVNAGTRLKKGSTIAFGQPLGIALGPVEVELHHAGATVSPALIAGSSAMLSNPDKDG